jgi:hypothetical protein
MPYQYRLTFYEDILGCEHVVGKSYNTMSAAWWSLVSETVRRVPGDLSTRVLSGPVDMERAVGDLPRVCFAFVRIKVWR